MELLPVEDQQLRRIIPKMWAAGELSVELLLTKCCSAELGHWVRVRMDWFETDKVLFTVGH